MKKEFAKKVINKIRANPGIHYDKLRFAFFEEPLYRLLYGLKEKNIITGKDTMIPTGRDLERGLERNIFWINEKHCTKEKLDETFEFWKL